MPILSLLALSAALEFGAVSGDIYQYAPVSAVQSVPPQYATASFQASLGPVFLKTAFRTDMWMQNGISWYPVQQSYEIGAGLRLGALVVGATHLCSHPLQPYQPLGIPGSGPIREGGYDTFYIRLQIGGNDK